MKKILNITAVLKSDARSSKGSMTLFISFIILPVLFFLFTLSMDMSVYFTRQQRDQEVLDDAALYAHRFLPDRGAAALAVDLYLQQNLQGYNKNNLTVTTGTDYVEVRLQNSLPFTFASIVDPDQGLIAIPYNVYSAARSTPLDIFMAVDTSSYLAPNPLGSSNDVWGDAVNWPEARFFSNNKQIFNITSGSTVVNNVAPAERLATQQCFNPVYSQQKRAAIQIYDYLGNFDLNYIGLGFYPFTGNDLDVARMPSKPGERNLVQNNYINNTGEASFNDFNAGIYHRNAYCAAAAVTEVNEQGHEDYMFPERAKNIRQTITDNTACSESIIDPISGNFNPDIQKCLHARDVIWSRSVSPSSQQNFPNTLRRLNTELIWTISKGEQRGGLIDSAAKVGIILAGDVPRLGNMRYPYEGETGQEELELRLNESLEETYGLVQQIAQQRRINYSLFYVIFAHQGIADANWQQRINRLRTSLDSFNNRKLLPDSSDNSESSFKIRLFTINNPENLANELLSLALLQKRTVMVAR